MSDLKYYTDDGFLNAPENGGVFYGFFTRLGGVSAAPYSGLNCGNGSNDKAEHIDQNRALVAVEAKIEPKNLVSLYQVHGADVVKVDKVWDASERPKADGFVTDVPGIGLGVLTADCAPVLFQAQNQEGRPIIGAAHAGWKGALSGVLDNVVIAMEKMGADKQAIRASVGPCISKSSYEVSNGFIHPFIEEDEESERFFFSGVKEGHLMLDLSGYCAWRMFRCGLRNVSMLDKDTYSNEEEFYSYRRMVHNGEPDYGRQISMISIQGL